MADTNTTYRLGSQVAAWLGQFGGVSDNPGMDYRANIRRLREAAGLTQKELAERCGWTQTRLSNYEIPKDRKGARTPDMDDALVLANALNVSVNELYGDTTSHPLTLNPETMSTALKLTEAMEFGRPKGDFFTWSETLIFCYNRVAAGGQAKLVDQFIEAAKDRPKASEGEHDDPERPGPNRPGGGKRR